MEKIDKLRELKGLLDGGFISQEEANLLKTELIQGESITGALKSDGQFKTVSVSNQTWMAENLNVSCFRNGTEIPEAQTKENWIKLGNERKAAWCYYENNQENKYKYGKLYNWYAIKDPRVLSPKGWHIPSDEEWTRLTTFLGGQNISGGILKEAGALHWSNPNTGATNTIGFSALPGGYRNNSALFSLLSYNCGFWSSTEISESHALIRYLSYAQDEIYIDDYFKTDGFSVRCIKDN
jgi:uncharacterized protein (TIGR02145 family)